MKLFVAIVTLGGLMLVPRAAAAQSPGQGARTDIGAKQGAQTFTVKKHFIVWGSMGLDLDLIGNVTNSGSTPGTIRGTLMFIDTTTYTDVYVKTPRRRYVGVGYGLFKKAEVFARYTDSDNPSSIVLVGHFGTNSNLIGVALDNYKDRMIEFGIRKYIATPRATRQYFALTGGMKTVEPIGMTVQAPDGDVRMGLYSKSRIMSVGLEFGASLEFHRIGLFLESGMRYQTRLGRDDTDLALYKLDEVNDTGIRIFMPVSVGLLVRF
jgi:hypothetical protein